MAAAAVVAVAGSRPQTTVAHQAATLALTVEVAVVRAMEAILLKVVALVAVERKGVVVAAAAVAVAVVGEGVVVAVATSATVIKMLCESGILVNLSVVSFQALNRSSF